MIGYDKLENSYRIGPTTESILALAPLHLCDIKVSGIIYTIRVFINFPTQVKCACMTIISPNPPNNLLQVNPIISLICTHGHSSKDPFYFHLIINHPGVPQLRN